MENEKIDALAERKGHRERILISACLLGEKCRYDGKGKEVPGLRNLAKYFDLIPICPESLGGLKIPRDPSEIVGDRVLSCKGRDVTENYRNGAYWVSTLARVQNVRYAILKDRSPSCGTTLIHDGSFSGKCVPGLGIAARRLQKDGLVLFNEEEALLLLSKMEGQA